MKRFRIPQIALLVAMVAFTAALSAAQMPPVNPAPGQNDGVIGPQLIAWSALQKPQPVPQKPQPIPGPDQAQPSSQDQQSPSQSAQPDQSTQPNAQQPEPETQQTTAQSVSGTVAKVSNKYVLQTADSVTYQLDDQSTAGQYMGKHVKVTGTLDRASGTIRVRSIELLS